MINSTLVTITSQGQITIPAKMRKALGFVPGSKVVASLESNKIHIEKDTDLLELIKTRKHKIPAYLKGKTMDEIIKIEKEAVADAVAERYLRKEARSVNKSIFA